MGSGNVAAERGGVAAMEPEPGDSPSASSCFDGGKPVALAIAAAAEQAAAADDTRPTATVAVFGKRAGSLPGRQPQVVDAQGGL